MNIYTCKDCLYYEVCGFHITEEINVTVDECNTGFKHKDQYVKLPVYIGQKVWIPYAWYNIPRKEIISELREGRVSMLQQKADKSWKFRVSHSYVSDFKLEDINNHVFFTKEAGEEALNRIIKNLEAQHNGN